MFNYVLYILSYEQTFPNQKRKQFNIYSRYKP